MTLSYIMELFVFTTFLLSLFLAYRLYHMLGTGKKTSTNTYVQPVTPPKITGYDVPEWLVHYRPSITEYEESLIKKIKGLTLTELKTEIANIYAIVTQAYCNGDLVTIKQLTEMNVWQKIQANLERRKQTGLNLNIEFSATPKIKIEAVETNPTTISVAITSFQFHIITDNNGREKEGSDNYAREVKEVWHVLKTVGSNIWKVSAIS